MKNRSVLDVLGKDGMNRRHAFTLVDLLVLMVVLAIVGLVLLPMIARSRARPKRINCTNNLKQAGLAFKIWAIDHGDSFPMQVSKTNGGSMEFAQSQFAWIHFVPMSNELSTPKVLVCPSDPERKPATDFRYMFNRNLSYFVNLDAKEGQSEMALAGDRNIALPDQPPKKLLALTSNSPVYWTSEMHMNNGNILLIDGSVQQLSSARLGQVFTNLPTEGIRLAVP